MLPHRSTLNVRRQQHHYVALARPKPTLTTLRPHPVVHLHRNYTSQTGGKVKGFMKKYGPVGVGVYLALSVLDLSLTMAVISVKGADKVMEAEDYVWSKVKGMFGVKHETSSGKPPAHHDKPSFTSLFVVAYGIHKTILLPVRLSLTAAITPAVVKRLRQLGWIHRGSKQ